MKKVHPTVAISMLISFSLLTIGGVRADDLVSLDDPAPAPAPKVAPRNTLTTRPANAPATGNLQSLDSLDDSPPAGGAGTAGAGALGTAPNANGGDTEVALDVGNEDSFNPYNFARTDSWALLPIGALILVGLHLIRVPKRKSKRKIDQARRFFRGISGDGTNSSILVATAPKGEKK